MYFCVESIESIESVESAPNFHVDFKGVLC